MGGGGKEYFRHCQDLPFNSFTRLFTQTIDLKTVTVPIDRISLQRCILLFVARNVMEVKDKDGSSMVLRRENDEDDEDDGWPEMTFRSKVEYVLRNITVEPLLAFFQVSSVLSNLTTQNLNLQKACRVNLRMDDRVCHGLENKNASFYAHEEVQVQQLVTDMLIWQTIIQSSVPCVLVIFVGSWSDRNRKRKPCMLVPIVGELIRNAGLLLCVYYFYELKLEAAGLMESVPTSIAGGLTVLYLAAFSYIGDVSSVSYEYTFLFFFYNSSTQLFVTCGRRIHFHGGYKYFRHEIHKRIHSYRFFFLI